MSFFKTFNKTKGFLNKSIDKTTGFTNKIIHGADKGLHIIGKVADIADKAAGALENVPVVGELAGAARGVIKGSKNLIGMGEQGLNKADKFNNKFGRMKIK